MRLLSRSLPLLLALLATLFGLPQLAQASAPAKALSTAAVQRAVDAYAKKRGLRPGRVEVQILGVTDSGKSTRAILKIEGHEVRVAINHDAGRVQSRQTAALVEGLLAAHKPYQRAGLGEGSSFANMLVDFKAGEGATLGVSALRRGEAAPLGRPRAGQSVAAQALDALSLGDQGAVTLALGKDLVAGRRGAGLRVRENGFGDAKGDIINQTPGLVEVMVGKQWHRLGYAGYKSTGDVLLLADAIDPIPAGAHVSVVRVSDAPNAPHPRGIDPTDDAVAAARGVKGFDLVSVEGLAGKMK